MYVLAASVDPANGSQWARVFRNQGYAHGQSHPSASVLRYPALHRPNPGCVLSSAAVFPSYNMWR